MFKVIYTVFVKGFVNVFLMSFFEIFLRHLVDMSWIILNILT